MHQKSGVINVLATSHDNKCGKVVSVSLLLSLCNPLDANLDRPSQKEAKHILLCSYKKLSVIFIIML